MEKYTCKQEEECNRTASHSVLCNINRVNFNTIEKKYAIKNIKFLPSAVFWTLGNMYMYFRGPQNIIFMVIVLSMHTHVSVFCKEVFIYHMQLVNSGTILKKNWGHHGLVLNYIDLYLGINFIKQDLLSPNFIVFMINLLNFGYTWDYLPTCKQQNNGNEFFVKKRVGHF